MDSFDSDNAMPIAAPQVGPGAPLATPGDSDTDPPELADASPGRKKPERFVRTSEPAPDAAAQLLSALASTKSAMAALRASQARQEAMLDEAVTLVQMIANTELDTQRRLAGLESQLGLTQPQPIRPHLRLVRPSDIEAAG